MDEVLALDMKKSHILFRDSIDKKMKNIKVTFKIFADGEKTPIWNQLIKCHVVFEKTSGRNHGMFHFSGVILFKTVYIALEITMQTDWRLKQQIHGSGYVKYMDHVGSMI